MHEVLPHGIQPICPSSPVFAFNLGDTPVAPDAHGLFTRLDISPAILYNTEEALYANPSTVSLIDWQAWGQNKWKVKHGTASAVKRFIDKLLGERTEFSETIPTTTYDHNAEQKCKTCDEAGDVLWCLLALVSNGSARLDLGIKDYLYRNSRNTVYLDEQTNLPVIPPWQGHSKELFGMKDAEDYIRIADIDTLAQQGFWVPPSSEMILDCTVTNGKLIVDCEDTQKTWDFEFKAEVQSFINMCEAQYAIGKEGTSIISTAEYANYRDKISIQAARILLIIANKLHLSCGGTVANAAYINTIKLGVRTQTGLVDKADGERPPEAL